MSTPATTATSGLVVIPVHPADLPALIHAVHRLGLPPGALSVIGKASPAAAAALAAEGDEQATAPTAAAVQAVARLVDPELQYEAFGAVLGATLGLLGGTLALLVPGLGTLVVAGGAAGLLVVEAAAAVAGLSAGSVIGALTDTDLVMRHEELFRQALARGQWIVLVRGTPAEVRQADLAARGFELEHHALF